MSLSILNAHTGSILSGGPVSFTSLDGFKSWIAQETEIDQDFQILMSSRGKQVKAQTLHTEKEIFLYDRRLLAGTNESNARNSHIRNPSFTRFSLPAPPSSIPSKDSTLQNWQKLFKERQQWATRVADASRKTVEQILELEQERHGVQRATALAVKNIKQHLENLNPKYQETKNWADQIIEDQRFLIDTWSDRLEKLKSIKASRRNASFLRNKRTKELLSEGGISPVDVRLYDLVDPQGVKKAGEISEELYQQFSEQVAEVKHAHDRVFTESDRVSEEFENLTTTLSDSEIGNRADGLIEEVEVLAGKLTADSEAAQKLPDTPKSLAQASRTSQLHESSFVNTLVQTNEEIRILLQQIIDLKADICRSSLQHLQNISTLESSIQQMHSLLANLNIDSKSSNVFETLNFAVRLPATYGSLIVEVVRRREYFKQWSEKNRASSIGGNDGGSGGIGGLTAAAATAQSEENKRRQRWSKEMIETVNVQNFDEMTSKQDDEQRGPIVNRQDIENYIVQLESVGGLDEAVKEVRKIFSSLDQSSRHQTKRESTFKNGSLYEATTTAADQQGRDPLIPRVTDDTNTITLLRKDKAKAEERLKSAKAQIRRLEDMLHRQSDNNSRPVSATGLDAGGAASIPTTFERQASSPVPNFTSALSKATATRDADPRRKITTTAISTPSRRVSFNQEADDPISLAKRVVSLEAELLAQKDHSRDLERKQRRSSSGRITTSNAEELLKEQAQDAIRTKEDLLSNLEAQKHEFDHDRLIFGDENKKLKIRIEELEDEIDRVCQSQEHEFKIQALNEDIDNIKREAASEMRRARQETEEIRQAYLTSRDHSNQMDRELRRFAEEKSQFQSQADDQLAQLRTRDQTSADHHRALRSILLHLSRKQAPEDLTPLIELIENAAESIAADKKSLESTLQSLKDDNSALNTRLTSQHSEIYDLRERVGNEERHNLSLREELERQSSHNDALQSQLSVAREEHQALASRMATGSTEADDLRERIQAEEQKNADIHSQVQDLEGKVQNLLTQLDEKRSELASLEGSYVRLNSNHEVQASRADEISKRLLVQNLTIQHLLEQVGFSVTKQENSTIIQKISSRTTTTAATSGSTTLNDPSTTTIMKRSISGPLPAQSELESMIDPEIRHWAKVDDSDKASKSYDEFINNVVNFDIEVFYETMYKRIKEIEHIARKSQRDARAYRDKAHRAQSEAHERLALRNFKEGDLALFLPTRDQATKPWAAFNVGAPHYFLREHDSHKLSKRDWLIARISKVEKRVVDLSKSINGLKLDERHGGTNTDHENETGHSADGAVGGAIIDDENPYELSDGLLWFLIDAAEEKPGAPINIGLGKTTVASVNVDAKGSIRMKKPSDGNGGATRTLTRSLDSRRSSTNSKKGLVAIAASNPVALEGMIEGARSPKPGSIDTSSPAASAEDNLRPDSSSRTLAIPHSRENQSEQARSAATSPSKSLRNTRPSPQRSVASPEKRKSKAWDALWSLDLNLESGKGKERHK